MKLNCLNFGRAPIKFSGLVALFFCTLPSVQADKITIGKGSGIVWEGKPFEIYLGVRVASTDAYPDEGLIAISDLFETDINCSPSDRFYKVNQYTTIKLADGVGLIPRAQGNVTYRDSSGNAQTINTWIGLPRTAGIKNDGSLIPVPFNHAGVSYDYCVPIKKFASNEGPINDAFQSGSFVRSSLSGTWVIVTNGNQAPQDNISVSQTYATMKAGGSYGWKDIFPSTFDLRISALSCSVDTPVDINFGSVRRNTVPHAELARMRNELYVSCSQDSARYPIKANINVQFRPISGLYNGEESKLALNEGGGYITGTIPGVTSEGRCGTSEGITFDNTQIKVGVIEETQSNVTLSHQLDWRLCSGGASLPSGKVTASAEMLVTYN